jgi:hypothetical protein
MENEKEVSKLEANETDVLKAIAFYLVKVHRIAPEGRKQKKSAREIDKMALLTVEYMQKNVDKKVLDDYFKAKKYIEE